MLIYYIKNYLRKQQLLRSHPSLDIRRHVDVYLSDMGGGEFWKRCVYHVLYDNIC